MQWYGLIKQEIHIIYMCDSVDFMSNDSEPNCIFVQPTFEQPKQVAAKDEFAEDQFDSLANGLSSMKITSTHPKRMNASANVLQFNS